MKTNDIPKAHPSLLDALHRQDAKAHEMRPSEGFTEKVMEKVKSERVNFRSSESNQARLNCRVVTKVSEAKSEKYKSLFIRKIAAVFIVAAFLGGLVFAAYRVLSHRQAPPTAVSTFTPQPSTLNTEADSLVRFTDIRLDSILAVVGSHYGREVCFRDTLVCALRLHTTWNRTQPLDSLVVTLNEFEVLKLTDEQDTLFVESIAEEVER